MVRLHMELDLISVRTAECLDEAGDIARQAGEHEYARWCSHYAPRIRQEVARGDV